MNLKWLIWVYFVIIIIILLLIVFVLLGLILMLSKWYRKIVRYGRYFCLVWVCDKGKVIFFLGDYFFCMKKKNFVFLYSCNENYY